jgi:mRNA-degrading endonuclease RelE of RelBE toxin-antitoxin system
MRIEPTDLFKREFKRLAKKFPSLQNELRGLVAELNDNPTLGTSIGMGCYKIRLSIASKGVGKRGGARVITYLRLVEEHIDLLTIYDKNEVSDISDKDILKIIEKYTD